jgi:two-component sensor histidine kinase
MFAQRSFGALSTKRSNVKICWGTHRAETGERTFFAGWREQGGPPVTVPSKQGSASMVHSSIVTQSLDGHVEFEFAEPGVTWTLTCPAKGVVDR